MNTIVDRRAWRAAIQRAIAWIAAAAFLGGLPQVEAADSISQPRWLLSTRSAPQCGDLREGAARHRYWRLDDDCRWTAQDAAQFRQADDSDAPIVVFVHGSRTDADGAVERGFAMYRTLQQHAADRPFHFVIWSWPSERDRRRVRRDMQEKLVYCDAESYYLAEWLAARKLQSRVCLIGYSFGSQIITGALHLAAGGELAGRSLPASLTENSAARKPVRAVLLAAAIDSAAMATGRENGRTLSLVDQMLVTENLCDRVLRWYPRIWRCGGPQAMGFVGPALNDGKEKVELIDVRCAVGNRHDVYAYMASGGVRSRLARYAFLEDDAGAAKP